MRSWKTPALLATVGLCGLGSLFAQGPLLPMAPEPTMVDSPALPIDSSSYQNPPTTTYSDSVAPAPVFESSSQPIVEHLSIEGSPVYSDSLAVPMPATGSCDGCASPAPEAAACCEAAPVDSCEMSAPVVMAAPPVYSAPAVAQPSCGCQGSGGR